MTDSIYPKFAAHKQEYASQDPFEFHFHAQTSWLKIYIDFPCLDILIKFPLYASKYVSIMFGP